jgi:uncharacterized lipoprotein YbaY
MPRIASPFLLGLAAMGLTLIGAGAAGITAHKAEVDPGGISTAALSRCAGLAGGEMREADAAFGELMLDGVPWLFAQQNHQAIVLSSTGTLRRRNGTTVPFRFLCALDDAGHANMFRVISAGVEEVLPPSRSIKGVAVPAGLEMPLARGVELRVQLLDVTKEPKGELLAEQIVRSGWQIPIPFALRVPADAVLDGRQLAIAARIVLARETLYRMERPRALTPEELPRPLTLELPPERRPTGER